MAEDPESYADTLPIDSNGTRRKKRAMQDDTSCLGYIRYVLYQTVKLVFLFENYCIGLLGVFVTAMVGYMFAMTTGDAHLALLYAVISGIIILSAIEVAKFVRQRFDTGPRVYIDTEIDSASCCFFLVILILLSLSITAVVLMDKNCHQGDCKSDFVFFNFTLHNT